MKKIVALSILVLLVISGCSAGGAQPTPTTSVDIPATAQAAASTALAHLTETSVAAIPTITETTTPPPPPTITATNAPPPEPIAAVARANVTVRSEPRKGSQNLGGIFFNQGLKVIARNDAANWYYIEWTKSPSGKAWVTANAVTMKEDDITRLAIAILDQSKRVVLFPPLIWTISGTPLPLNTPAADAKTATINQLAKVRIGPGVGYATMGTINNGATVSVTGRTENNGWLQIEYPSGPGGRGWVAGDLANMQSPFAGLPYYNLLATPSSDPEIKPTANPNETPEPSPTPQPTLAGPPAVITGSEVNVRSGPASSYKIIGTLKLGDSVVITGLTLNRLWYRIAYVQSESGVGWVAVAFVKVTGGDMTKLTFYNDQGTPIP